MPSLPKMPEGLIRNLVLGLLLAFLTWTSFFTVPAEADGIILRFGRYQGSVAPGLHLKLPLGIDEVIIVPVRRQLKQEFGFGTAGATNASQATPEAEWEEEKAMVTGDLNAAQVEWVVQYRIQNATDYLFHVRNADDTLRDASESILREVIGDRTIDEVLTIGRQEIEDEALQKLQRLVHGYTMGLRIDQVQLKNVDPPKRVQASFNEVNQAQQERESAINVANGEYNKSIPRARGLAEQAIREAEGYAAKRVNEAEGDAKKFALILAEYEKAPEVTRRRIYLETIKEILPRVQRKFLVDERAKGVLPLLNLNANEPTSGEAKQ
jgi:membrane protease subunit HflK